MNAAYETLFTAEALLLCESRQDRMAALFTDLLLEQQAQQQQQQLFERLSDSGVAAVPVVAAATLLLRFEQAGLVSKHLLAALLMLKCKRAQQFCVQCVQSVALGALQLSRNC